MGQCYVVKTGLLDRGPSSKNFLTRNLVVRGDNRLRRPVRSLLHRTVRHAGARLRAPDRPRSLPQEQPGVRLLPHAVALVVGAR